MLAILARDETDLEDTDTESDEESSIKNKNSEDDEEETESRDGNHEENRTNCDHCENGVLKLVYLASCLKTPGVGGVSLGLSLLRFRIRVRIRVMIRISFPLRITMQ